MYHIESGRPPYCDECGWYHYEDELCDGVTWYFEDEYPDEYDEEDD